MFLFISADISSKSLYFGINTVSNIPVINSKKQAANLSTKEILKSPPLPEKIKPINNPIIQKTAEEISSLILNLSYRFDVILLT